MGDPPRHRARNPAARSQVRVEAGSISRAHSEPGGLDDDADAADTTTPAACHRVSTVSTG
jgi:hypothetical protein